jgi:hypothetical protein
MKKLSCYREWHRNDEPSFKGISAPLLTLLLTPDIRNPNYRGDARCG